MRPGNQQINSPSHGLEVESARSRLPAPARRELSQQEKRNAIMRVAALQEAEQYLGDVCATWYLLSLDDCAIAIKHALGWLTVIALASPTRAAIWYRELALAAGISKTDLRREIENRADFWRNFNDFANKRRDETVGALCEILF